MASELGPLSEFGESRVSEYEERREPDGTTFGDTLAYHTMLFLELVILLCFIISLVLVLITPVTGEYWGAAWRIAINLAVAGIAILLERRIGSGRWWFDE